MATNPIPEGYHSLTPSLIVRDASRAIEFYKKVFGAEETLRLAMPDGSIAHAEVRIGDSILMLADESPQWGTRSPESIGGSGSGIMLYVEDVDAVFRRAIENGASEVSPVENQFYGDRSGQLQDPFGHRWTIATNVEVVPEDEMNRRMEQFLASMG